MDEIQISSSLQNESANSKKELEIDSTLYFDNIKTQWWAHGAIVGSLYGLAFGPAGGIAFALVSACIALLAQAIYDIINRKIRTNKKKYDKAKPMQLLRWLDFVFSKTNDPKQLLIYSVNKIYSYLTLPNLSPKTYNAVVEQYRCFLNRLDVQDVWSTYLVKCLDTSKKNSAATLAEVIVVLKTIQMVYEDAKFIPNVYEYMLELYNNNSNVILHKQQSIKSHGELFTPTQVFNQIPIPINTIYKQTAQPHYDGYSYFANKNIYKNNERLFDNQSTPNLFFSPLQKSDSNECDHTKMTYNSFTKTLPKDDDTSDQQSQSKIFNNASESTIIETSNIGSGKMTSAPNDYTKASSKADTVSVVSVAPDVTSKESVHTCVDCIKAHELTSGKTIAASLAAKSTESTHIVLDVDSRPELETNKSSCLFSSFNDLKNFDEHLKHKIPISDSECIFIDNFISEDLPEWTKVYDNADVRIYKQITQFNGSDLVMVKAYADLVNITVENIMFNLKNAKRRVLWDKTLESYLVVDSNIENNDIVYNIIRAPWPIASRDFLQWRLIKEAEDGSVYVMHRSAEHPAVPEKPDSSFVRAESVISAYKFIPYNGGTKLFLVTQVDVRGRIPKWVVNSLAAKAPLRWIEHFRQACTEYINKPLSMK